MKNHTKKTRLSIISSGYNIVWLTYTLHYILLFSIISSDWFDERAHQAFSATLLPLNIIMNSTSIILAVIGVFISHQAAKQNTGYWTILNTIIHILMILWIFGGSLWIILFIL